MYLGLVATVELTVKCNILTNHTCLIDKQIQLKADDTLNFIVDNANNIKVLDIVQGSKLVTIPVGIFKTFPELEELFVSDLGISVLMSNRFEGAEKLKALNIYKNQIEVIPSKVFMTLSNTVEVLLTSNKIESIKDYAFDGMVKLDMLKLNYNRIKSLGRLAFAGAPNIRIIDLDGNYIETIEEGALSLPNLENLYVRNNKLRIISDKLLVGASKLQRLHLDTNEITRVGKAFNDCMKLKILSLSNNPVEDVNLSTIATLKDLDTLFLDYTYFQFSQKIPSTTSTESKLKTIWLNGNELSSPDILKHLSIFRQMEEIIVTENKFTIINDIDKIRNYFPQLRRFGLAGNKPTLCTWISDNEKYFKNMSVWSTTADNKICRSADYKPDQSTIRD